MLVSVSISVNLSPAAEFSLTPLSCLTQKEGVEGGLLAEKLFIWPQLLKISFFALSHLFDFSLIVFDHWALGCVALC